MRGIGLMCAAVLVSGVAMAQAPAGAPAPPVGPAAEVQRSYAALKGNILKAAEKMPEAEYAVVPIKDVRTFARVVNHITEAQFRSCGISNGVAPKDIAKPPADTADKATVIAGLNAAFAECDKAFATLTDANVAELLTAGPAKRSRIGLAWGTVSHDNEQYAILSLYLRLKGLAPPTSEK